MPGLYQSVSTKVIKKERTSFKFVSLFERNRISFCALFIAPQFHMEQFHMEQAHFFRVEHGSLGLRSLQKQQRGRHLKYGKSSCFMV